MPTTSLLSGVTINEVHGSPAGGQDYNGSGAADQEDQYIELVNTSGSAVDISGWEIFVFPGVAHTFASGTILAAGGHITVVDSEGGTGNAISGVTGTAVYSDATLGLGTAANIMLYSTATNEFIALQGSLGGAWLGGDIALVTAAHVGASQVGSSEVLPSPSTSLSMSRVPDGDSNWQNVTPTPGAVECFLPGTLITMADGDKAVEDIRIGEDVLLSDGRQVPVKWVGRQTVRLRGALPASLEPVCISAGALGAGLPKRDLYVTANHGMILDDLVINASALVNGSTIRFVPLAELPMEYVVYHVETEAHGVIFANAAASESFLDAAGRAEFENYQEYVDLYGVERLIPEMSLPRIASPRLLPEAIKTRLGVVTADPTADFSMIA